METTGLQPVFDDLKTNFILIRAIRGIRGKSIAVLQLGIGKWRRTILGLE